MMKKSSIALGAALCIGIAAASAEAQTRHRTLTAPSAHVATADWTDANEFSMEPYVGVYLDGMVPGNERAMGPLVGLRLGFEPMHRLRFLLDAGYSEVNGVGAMTVGTSTFTYGHDWIFTLAGMEFDVIPGNTVGTITLGAGGAWQRIEAERRILGTDDDPESGEFNSFVVVAPGVAFAHMLSPRGAVRLSIQDFIVGVDEDPEHSPAFTLGIVFR